MTANAESWRKQNGPGPERLFLRRSIWGISTFTLRLLTFFSQSSALSVYLYEHYQHPLLQKYASRRSSLFYLNMRPEFFLDSRSDLKRSIRSVMQKPSVQPNLLQDQLLPRDRYWRCWNLSRRAARSPPKPFLSGVEFGYPLRLEIS